MKTFGPVDSRSVQQLENCRTASCEQEAPSVLCADHHPGYSMPIGGVIALKDSVIPAGVGYDIGCGNCAVKTNILARDVNVRTVMDEIWKTISFGIGRKNDEKIKDHPIYDEIAASPVLQQRSMLEMAQNQLGTVGSGNHYVDLFEDRGDGHLWVGVHFGSRGFGHKTASGFLAIAAGKTFEERVGEGDMDAAPLLLPLNMPTGQDYLEGMAIAGRYAYAGRSWVVNRVLRILGGKAEITIHNHHNYAWKEKHFGDDYLVIRKGATPAFPGQRGFIGGTMGDDAVIVEGVDSLESQAALYSTVHGAGRVMSRTQAAGKVKINKFWVCGNRNCKSHTEGIPIYARELRRGGDGSLPRCKVCENKLHLNEVARTIKAGIVDWSKAQESLKTKGIELRGAGADEAPECYKNLFDVLSYHRNTIKVLHQLRPVGVAMAGADTFDPYKD